MPPQRSPASSSTENEMIGIGGESGSIRVWSIRVFSKDREMYGTRRVKPKITNPSILDSYLSLHSLIMARGFPFSFFFFLFFFFFFFWERKKGKNISAVAGDRTRVTRVTGGNTYHYTTTTRCSLSLTMLYLSIIS